VGQLMPDAAAGEGELGVGAGPRGNPHIQLLIQALQQTSHCHTVLKGFIYWKRPSIPPRGGGGDGQKIK
jgi:hypothetical protein